MKTKLKMMLIAAFAASMVFVVKAADYTLASGQTDTISASATYGAMTVNGALTLANGAKSTSVTADSLTVGGDAEHGYGSVTLGGLPTLSVGAIKMGHATKQSTRTNLKTVYVRRGCSPKITSITYGQRVSKILEVYYGAT